MEAFFLGLTLSLSPPDLGGEGEEEDVESEGGGGGGGGWLPLPAKVFEFSNILKSKVFFSANRIAVNILVCDTPR